MPDVKIYLFDSYATGRARPGSDVDIALDAGQLLDKVVVGEIREVLDATNIAHHFDISDFHRLPQDIQTMVKKEGIVWKN